MLIDDKNKQLSIRCQCKLLGIPRSTFYYQPAPIDEYTLEIMNEIDMIYTKYPFYGSRKIKVELGKKGYPVNIKRVRRLMKEMGIRAIYPEPNASAPNKHHHIYPYLLKGVKISYPNHVWSTDITYLKLKKGFLYLVAIIDWYSRYVLSWELSNTIDTFFCVTALEEALEVARPDIFNSDQGAQFTSNKFEKILLDRGIKISMDSKGRALDNIFVERLWRTVKYEDIYLKNYESVQEIYQGLKEYFYFYNYIRVHQSLYYKTPAEIYFDNMLRR
jgi:putative transposase